jgi:hypothetical protein
MTLLHGFIFFFFFQFLSNWARGDKFGSKLQLLRTTIWCESLLFGRRFSSPKSTNSGGISSNNALEVQKIKMRKISLSSVPYNCKVESVNMNTSIPQFIYLTITCNIALISKEKNSKWAACSKNQNEKYDNKLMNNREIIKIVMTNEQSSDQ